MQLYIFYLFDILIATAANTNKFYLLHLQIILQSLYSQMKFEICHYGKGLAIIANFFFPYKKLIFYFNFFG